MERVYAVIPARGNSKGIHNKNLLKIGNDTLIEIAIKRCLESKVIDEIVVTSESDQILSVAENYPVSLVERPEMLSEDTAHAIYPTVHALDEVDANDEDTVFMVLPTTPLINAALYDQAYTFLKKSQAPSIIGITKLENIKATSLRFFDNNMGLHQVIPELSANLQRQHNPPLWYVNGGLFLSRFWSLIKNETFHVEEAKGFVMDEVIDIDTTEDYRKVVELAE
jgi:CMP-N-acetylneuraminic acid synthetase